MKLSGKSRGCVCDSGLPDPTLVKFFDDLLRVVVGCIVGIVMHVGIE
jgi:hypothetical protein